MKSEYYYDTSVEALKITGSNIVVFCMLTLYFRLKKNIYNYPLVEVKTF